MKKSTLLFLALAAVCGGMAGTTATADDSIRTIVLTQDDGQVRFGSRIYELKNVSSEAILPFVNAAIQRYSKNSTIKRIVATDPNAKDAILVSTGVDFLPYVDEIVKALDYNSAKKDSPVIQGTGISRIAYSPRYRAANQFEQIIDSTLGTDAGKAYVNLETNTIFWRDQQSSAENTLRWMEKLDRPLPQVNIRLNYYELRDSDLKDWGFDYLAWKNGPGVNLLNVGYNTGKFAMDQLLNATQYIATSSWGYGGFFAAPQFDMSFIRCLQQSGNASIAAHASMVMVNTPVSSELNYLKLIAHQIQNPGTAPFIYRMNMYPEYQNIAKNTLGRSFIGKSFYEDANGVKHPYPPVLSATIVNPFVCLPAKDSDKDAQGFIPADAKFQERKNSLKGNGGVLFNYSLNFQSVVERGNTGSELSNSMVLSGAATLGFGGEKILTIYEKEHDVEQTIGLPILCRIPYLKYLFSTVTTIKERTYIVVTAEAELMHPEGSGHAAPVSVNANIDRRIENPFRPNTKE